MQLTVEIPDKYADSLTVVAASYKKSPQEFVQMRVDEILGTVVRERRDRAVEKLEKMSDADRAEVLSAIDAKPVEVRVAEEVAEEVKPDTKPK